MFSLINLNVLHNIKQTWNISCEMYYVICKNNLKLSNSQDKDRVKYRTEINEANYLNP